jgi:hypothetical protein
LQDEEPSDDSEDGIPDEDIMEFRSRDDIKQKREELREKLQAAFNELCAKKCCVIRAPGIAVNK